MVGLGRAQSHQQQKWDREESNRECHDTGTCLGTCWHVTESQRGRKKDDGEVDNDVGGL